MKEESIIAIIVALIGTLPAIIIKLLENNRSNKSKSSSQDEHSKQINKKTRIYRILFLVSILIAVCGTVPLIKLTIFPSKLEISLSNVNDSTIVEQTTTLEGTYKNITKDEKIWVFINSLEVNRYYPQNTSAELDANGNWSSLTYFGQEKDSGKMFKIIVVLVNKDAVSQIQTYLKEAINKKDYQGMAEIPNKAVIYVQKIVKRK